MTEITVSPELPGFVLDTFEGKLISAWIGHRDHFLFDGTAFVEFSGDTENEDDEDIILLEMDEAQVLALAKLGEEAGTPVCAKIARLLRNPVELEIMNEHFNKIDISAIRIEVELKNENGEGYRMLEVDDLLLSLVTRFPDQIPYAAVTWDDGATLITASGVEWFKDIEQRDARLEEFDSGVGAFAEGKRPSEEAARAAVETWLDEHAPGYPDYSLHEDGDDGWAFYVATEDTTSYVHHDLKIEWYGTGWPENYQYDEETGDWSSVSPAP